MSASATQCCLNTSRLYTYSRTAISIKSTLPHFYSIAWKLRVSISSCYVCLVFYVCHSAFYAGTCHLTSTRRDRQRTPVDPTGVRLWNRHHQERQSEFRWLFVQGNNKHRWSVLTLWEYSFTARWSDHYFRSVCWFVCLSVCLFVQSFSQPSLIRFRSN